MVTNFSTVIVGCDGGALERRVVWDGNSLTKRVLPPFEHPSPTYQEQFSSNPISKTVWTTVRAAIEQKQQQLWSGKRTSYKEKYDNVVRIQTS
uniref:Uncharacterized protein n=1 Tax=Onchocerca ochengi TaxID=42157 RepID=A0A182E4I0_ONCOC